MGFYDFFHVGPTGAPESLTDPTPEPAPRKIRIVFRDREALIHSGGDTDASLARIHEAMETSARVVRIDNTILCVTDLLAVYETR